MELRTGYKIYGVKFENIEIYVDLIVDQIIVTADNKSAYIGFEREDVIELLKVLKHAID